VWNGDLRTMISLRDRRQDKILWNPHRSRTTGIQLVYTMACGEMRAQRSHGGGSILPGSFDAYYETAKREWLNYKFVIHP